MLINEIGFCNITKYHDGTCIVTKSHCPADPDERNKPDTNKKRVYKIKKIVVRSLLIDLWNRRRSKFALFFTVTLPFVMDEHTAAVCWNNFLNNMRNRYKLCNYVWIKEFQKNGNIHYHIIIDRNRVGIKYLQKTWNNVIFNVTGINPEYSNSIRLGNNPIIRNIKTVAGYLSKYISKEKTEFTGKAMGNSQNLTFFENITPDEFEELANKYGLVLIADEQWYRVYVLKNYFDSG